MGTSLERDRMRVRGCMLTLSARYAYIAVSRTPSPTGRSDAMFS